MSQYRPYGGSVPNAGPLLDVESTIRELSQDFCTSFNTGNYDHCAALFAPEGYLMAPHHEPVQGTKAIERKLQDFADHGYQDLRWETVQVDHSGDMAVEIGRYTVSVRRGNGSTVIDRGKYLNCWRRLGAWRILAGCWNSNLPAIISEESRERQLPEVEKPEIIASDVQRSA